MELSVNQRNNSEKIQQLEAQVKAVAGERQRYQDVLQSLQNEHQNYQSKLQEENMQLLNEVGLTVIRIFFKH